MADGAMTFLECPNCSAKLEIDLMADQEEVVCENCGTMVATWTPFADADTSKKVKGEKEKLPVPASIVDIWL